MEPPFAYLDFETVAPPIPVWNRCRPYDQVPVQLSIHREAPGSSSSGARSSGGRPTHHEWLADGGMKEADRTRLRRDLLRYCRTDIEALVKVHRALAGMA